MKFWMTIILLLAGALLAPGQTINRDLPLDSASYLGGIGDAGVVAGHISADGSLFLAGNFEAGFIPPGVIPDDLGGSGVGAVIRMAASGGGYLGMTRLNGRLNHMAANEEIVVLALADGLLVLEADARTVRHDLIAVSAIRVAVADDGGFAALGTGNRVNVYDPSATLLGTRAFDAFTRLDDVAITPAGDIVVTGYNQLNSNLKSPVLECYTPSLDTRLWKAYGFANGQVTGACLGADSEGERVAVGSDGFLYFSGATDGGNTVFQRNPADITSTLPSGGDPDQHVLIQTDPFNQPFQLSGSAKFSFHGRFDPQTGTLLKAQFLLTRLSNGNQNTLRIRELTADTAGNVILVGLAFADIEGRSMSTVAGQPVGPYAGGNMFALIIEADYRDRLYWTSFNGSNPGTSEGVALGVRGDVTRPSGRFVFAGNLFDPGNEAVITASPLQFHPQGGQEVYYAIRGPDLAALIAQWPDQVDIRDLLPFFSD